MVQKSFGIEKIIVRVSLGKSRYKDEWFKKRSFIIMDILQLYGSSLIGKFQGFFIHHKVYHIFYFIIFFLSFSSLF